jgi:hypothetical protein
MYTLASELFDLDKNQNLLMYFCSDEYVSHALPSQPPICSAVQYMKLIIRMLPSFISPYYAHSYASARECQLQEYVFIYLRFH